MPMTTAMRNSTVPPEPTPSESADLASILNTLPTRGAEDDVSRLMDIYESVERVYREASAAGTPVIGASSSANL
jgi:hypothetical protein